MPFLAGCIINWFDLAVKENWKLAIKCMGVESGGRGEGDPSPAVEKSAGDVPPEIIILQYLFYTFANLVFWIDSCFEHCCDKDIKNLVFSNIFEIKWSKSEEKLNLGGMWVWVPMNPSPQTKLGGYAHDKIYILHQFLTFFWVFISTHPLIATHPGLRYHA